MKAKEPMTVRAAALALLILSCAGSPAQGQERAPRWERRVEATEVPLTAFHATQAFNLPTAETLSKGEWQFEIAHRFFPPVSEGAEAFWGLDGPVTMRLGLGYAPTDALLVTVARSNLQDNWDFQAKLRLLQSSVGSLPLLAAVQGGMGWSTDVGDRDASDAGNYQLYGQVVLNTLVARRVALGVVPSYLDNVLLDDGDRVGDVYLGLYGQWYLPGGFSVAGEWNLGERRGELQHDTGAFGVELETGGHFFKVFLTNSVRLNPSQFLAGSDFDFQPDEWRLGFSITRLLRF